MKCVICHGDRIRVKSVFEEIPHGPDMVRVPLEIPVCATCGERYYDRATMRTLEKIREEIAKDQATLVPVGRVLECRP